jgi:hypothetical protein
MGHSIPSGNNQIGEKMNKEINPNEMLINSFSILEQVYKRAKRENNLEAMLAVSDRMLVLFDKSVDLKEYKKMNKNKKKIVGFSPLSLEPEED